MSQVYEIVADLGGTNARFACINSGKQALQHITTLHCADFPALEDAVRHYMASLPGCAFSKLCLAVAAPVEQDWISFVNNPWSFSCRQLQLSLDVQLVTINDFTAQAYCLETLQESELEWLGSPRPAGNQIKIVMGPGTGLGVAGLTPGGDLLPSEGGHLAFAPLDDHEIAILQLLWKRYPRVSVERLLSGPGLANLHWANSIIAGSERNLSAEHITAAAMQGDPISLQSIQIFLGMLAATAGDMALALGALDGVYLSGGVLPHLTSLLDREQFRQRFDNKGRFQEYCSRIPLTLVTAENTGLRGCVVALGKVRPSIF